MKRIDYIDRARALGMFLVYYGHFVEKLAREAGLSSALFQWKAVYSFHMPFFFFIAGVFWKPAPLSADLFREKIRTRIIPSIFFSLLLIPLWLLFDPDRLWKLLSRADYLSGRPLNSVLWFIVCLMTVELLAALVAKYLQIDSARLLMYAGVAFCFGYFVLVNRSQRVLATTGIDPRSWYLDDAFIALLFYLLGYVCREWLFQLDQARNGWLGLMLALVSGALLLVAFFTNPEDGVVVVMSSSAYGHIGYFLVTALLGIAFLITVSRAFALRLAVLSFIGQNSLIFLGLNGINFLFLDAWLIGRFPWLPARQVELLLFCSAYAALMLLTFLPLAWGIRRWLPELSGYNWSPTSLLPPMSDWGKNRAVTSIHLWLRKYLLRSVI